MGGMGHLVPVLDAAAACRRLGHQVVVLVPPSLAGEVARAGLPQAVGADPPRAEVEALWARVRAGTAGPGLIDRELFAGRAAAAMLGAARSVRESFSPQLVVREPCEHATAVAAHEAGIGQVVVGISPAAVEREVLAMVAPALDAYAAGLGAAVAATPYLSSFPASLDPSPWPDTRRYRRVAPPPGPLPAWWPGDDRPLVYVTLGSVTGHLPEAGPAFRVALEAVATLPVRVLVTVGRGAASEALGPVPANVHVEPWVPQDRVLPHAAAVVCHGGSGTTVGALAAGVPVVACPLFADQPANGRMVEEAGAGILVPGREGAAGGLLGLGPADVGPLRQAIGEVVANPTFRRAAAAVAAEVRGQPALHAVLGSLVATA